MKLVAPAPRQRREVRDQKSEVRRTSDAPTSDLFRSKPDPVARAIRGAAGAALSNEQKAALVMMAREAFEKQGHRTGMAFDEWRYEQTEIACGKASLRAATNGDYKSIEAHFKMIAGKPRAAVRAAIAAQTQDRTFARAKLDAEIVKVSDVLPNARNYAAGFLRNARNVELDDATATQLWSAVFLIRRRAQQLRRKLKS